MQQYDIRGIAANPAPGNDDPAAIPGPLYEYKTLAELAQDFIPGVYNFFAFVTDCSVPRPTSKGE